MLFTAICIFPYGTQTRKQIFSVFQQPNYYLDVHSCCSCILFVVIWQKILKHSLEFVTVWGWWWCYLLWSTEVFQFNALNRHRFITIIVFRLNLVWRTSYYTLCIVFTAQHIVVNFMTLECLLSRIYTVICSKNMYVCQVWCKFMYGWYVDLLMKVHNWCIHNYKIFSCI